MNDIEKDLSRLTLQPPSRELDERMAALFATAHGRTRGRKLRWLLAPATLVAAAALVVFFLRETPAHHIEIRPRTRMVFQDIGDGGPNKFDLSQKPEVENPTFSGPTIIVLQSNRDIYTNEE